MGEIIKIYCDGACRGNGEEINIGAYGAILLYEDNIKEISAAEPNTTNNIMELKGAIIALSSLKVNDIPVEVYCDSNYVVQGIDNWICKWIKNNWRTSTKKPVENKELWKELYSLKNKFENITFIKVKGHSGNDFNEKADTLCNLAMDEYIRINSK